MIFQNESVDIDTELSYSCDAELDDEIIGKALSSPLFIQEREEPANLRQADHSHEESLLPAQSFFTRTSTGRPVYEPRKDLSQKRKSSRDSENEQIRILLERQKEQILSGVRTEIQKHELQADGQGNEVPKAGRQQAAADSARQLQKRNSLSRPCTWRRFQRCFRSSLRKTKRRRVNSKGQSEKAVFSTECNVAKKKREEKQKLAELPEKLRHVDCTMSQKVQWNAARET